MKLLIIIDYQNDFVDGSLGFPKAKELDERIVERIKQYDDIIFTMDTHDENYLTILDKKTDREMSDILFHGYRAFLFGHAVLASVCISFFSDET